ncbi:hypothetical protein ATANTOWER_003513, partial [Ataeniobius toweri]|nr:hypothetical protein [Ataeniobius toweri]
MNLSSLGQPCKEICQQRIREPKVFQAGWKLQKEEGKSKKDPGLQDPLSLSLNGKYCGQTSGQQKERKAPGSLGYTCDPPEIQVVIKEEDENWTVSEN